MYLAYLITNLPTPNTHRPTNESPGVPFHAPAAAAAAVRQRHPAAGPSLRRLNEWMNEWMDG